nr:Na+/H+ antiporter NhaA [Hankyongella ginsenosidimutans]
MLLAAALIAMLVANSPLNEWYQGLRHLKLELGAPPLSLALSVEHWVNDALMALFFLLVGLELKREMLQGELSRKGQMLLPLTAALGGMAAPAAVYLGVIQGMQRLRMAGPFRPRPISPLRSGCSWRWANGFHSASKCC